LYPASLHDALPIYPVECGRDLVRDVVAASRVEVRFTQIDVAGRYLSRFADEAAQRSNERAGQKDPDHEGEQNTHHEHERRVEGGVVSRPCVGGERYGEDVAPGLVHETWH